MPTLDSEEDPTHILCVTGKSLTKFHFILEWHVIIHIFIGYKLKF